MPNDEADTCNAKLALAIESLVLVLSAKDGMLRQVARRALEAMGEPALEPLSAALKDQRKTVRWEAAKALSEMADPSSACALVAALEDELFSVRWLAAEGLIKMGIDGLPPLLEALMLDPDSSWLREGAHHVLRVLSEKGHRDILGPVVESLEGLTGIKDLVPSTEAALIALGCGDRLAHRKVGRDHRQDSQD